MKTSITFSPAVVLSLFATVAGTCLVSVPAQAQTAAPVAKASPTKAATKSVPGKKATTGASRIEQRSEEKNRKAGIEAADDALTPAELAIAERVYVGQLPCELGASVSLVADTKAPGYFTVQGKNFKYRMFPVPTTTGTVRLEDRKAGAVWLQMGNKSMLMNQKSGTRLADECMSPAQVAVAEALKLNPATSVLDAPRPTVPAGTTTDLSAASASPTMTTPTASVTQAAPAALPASAAK